MSRMHVTLDITELCHNPVRSGIQRVVRELLRNWPGGEPPTCGRFEPGQGLLHVPDAAVALLAETNVEGRSLTWAELRARQHAMFPLKPLAQASGPGLILIPEVFYDPQRCRFYEDKLASFPGSVAMLFYDFLAYLKSDLFRLPSLLPFMHYARLARSVPHAAFISHKTRVEYATRIRQVPGWSSENADATGPVLPLGSDGLNIERQRWSPDRRQFVSLGSIDGRKNQHVAAAAFMQLWDEGYDIPLVLIGTVFDRQGLEWVEAARRYKQFTWLDVANDGQVADMLRQARATLYLSEVEGFGLPPVESLAAGIPVIASNSLPSLQPLPPGGQIRLAEVTPEAVKAAVLGLNDDAAAEAAWAGASGQRLSTWKVFGERTAEWCTEIMSMRADAGNRAHKG